ncbi:hypothetical protein, partial [Sorangium cellulosum]|uniref:hypothetical protein n=1 Tax=Sorangium cellulosum TaxID=56 RepID=UPI0018F3FC7C
MYSLLAAFTGELLRAYSPRMLFIPRTSIRLFMTTGALIVALAGCGDDDSGTVAGSGGTGGEAGGSTTGTGTGTGGEGG